MSKYQERIFLHLLDNTSEVELAKRILKSPLGLAADIIYALFEDRLVSKKDELDKIKMFAAGISRSEKLGSNYSLAKYYPYMFSFQQFFHSSFRARQGKVLEEMIKNILENYTDCNEVPKKVDRMQEILRESFASSTITSLDIDAMGINNKKNKIVVIQLRSRDDTGGTTAKSSLVELLRSLMRLKNLPKEELLYLICIWDERNSQQKQSTITKIYSSLQDYIPDENKFRQEIIQGYELNSKIKLKLAYGTDEISRSLFEWTGTNQQSILTAIQQIIDFVENWDDLWVTYSISNIELELNSFQGISNINLLNQKFNEINAKFDFSSYEKLKTSIDEITNQILPIWREKTIPLASLSDKAHYVRDLVFLKACYSKIRNN
ncbi:hypothetical protein IQ224_02885 [Microcystis sp. LEGE 00066]|uniref:Uncharacterized protein n=3 Tax=Microcystis aeruginosa TaxID=1126 RepID=A0A552EUL8_MICAE|nr:MULTISPECIES: hypothetical protein [Microcystis]TRU05717.1 MAG: hypothetical protein EWV61_04205 [Microcystis aeruginosa Ma_AC_P_19900807_S300]TRU33080.1 MAG: hypothetical protein EWV50_21015 [Microcystis aeruginosa Ma_MB_F_20061100_S20]TRU38161.1 MAG: hypothetical protein EWV78_05740 [Microcystis aeruginosa Ma_MB_F_20061100_S20D]ARI84109.1 hypothetical protein BH695_4830 [Microcystis aeruginosa PCC 7806SL]ELS47554.1 hypothetical protein C789_2670 [Microcystis aeruginosa FACHB-905 = DIANCHI